MSSARKCEPAMPDTLIAARDRLMRGWQRLNGSLWFLPGWIVIGAAALAVLMVEVSAQVEREVLAHFPRIFGATADGSRSMLATIAGSMITVAGVTFSIMVVAVSQASSQYTPRILRNFMRDRLSQTALGVLTGVFVYCLVVIRTIRGEGELQFVPALAVFGAFVLAIVAVGFLMYFIHHIASTLEPGSILAGVNDETVAAVDRLFPDALGDDPRAAQQLAHAAATSFEHQQWSAIRAHETGYVQHVDADGLLQLAIRHSAVIRMERTVGEFVIEAMPLASIACVEPDEALARAVNGMFVIDSYRTVYQDAGFGVRQMVDIALKALSPGVNDTTTAVSCIDYLAAVLVRVAGRRIPSPYRLADGRLRVIARGPTFDDLLSEAFAEIRQCAASNVRVLTCVLDALVSVAAATRSPARLTAILEQIELIGKTEDQITLAADRAAVTAGCDRARASIESAMPRRAVASAG